MKRVYLLLIVLFSLMSQSNLEAARTPRSSDASGLDDITLLTGAEASVGPEANRELVKAALMQARADQQPAPGVPGPSADELAMIRRHERLYGSAQKTGYDDKTLELMAEAEVADAQYHAMQETVKAQMAREQEARALEAAVKQEAAERREEEAAARAAKALERERQQAARRHEQEEATIVQEWQDAQRRHAGGPHHVVDVPSMNGAAGLSTFHEVDDGNSGVFAALGRKFSQWTGRDQLALPVVTVGPGGAGVLSVDADDTDDGEPLSRQSIKQSVAQKMATLDAPATRIQAAARGMLARHRLEADRKNAPATMIQKRVRGMQARAFAQRKRAERISQGAVLKMIEQMRADAATQMQRVVRGKLARNHATALRADRTAKEKPEVDKPATVHEHAADVVPTPEPSRNDALFYTGTGVAVASGLASGGALITLIAQYNRLSEQLARDGLLTAEKAAAIKKAKKEIIYRALLAGGMGAIGVAGGVMAARAA